MDKLENYRRIIQEVLTEYASHKLLNEDKADEFARQTVFDTKNDHYQVLDIGWDGLKRVYNCFIHIDIKDGKIWIQRNMTKADLAQALVEMGVPRRRYCPGAASTL